MHDFLQQQPDPVEEAKNLLSLGEKDKALCILTPILREIQASKEIPSPTLQGLMEKLIIQDALKYGIH